jgi:hypothetical protein
MKGESKEFEEDKPAAKADQYALTPDRDRRPHDCYTLMTCSASNDTGD